jgi:hypothetical protein
MKTKIKPRRMFINPSDMIEPYAYLTSYRDPSADHGNTLPVAVIPLHNVEQIVLEALYAWGNHKGEDTASSMRAALTAIGVLPKAKKGRK